MYSYFRARHVIRNSPITLPIPYDSSLEAYKNKWQSFYRYSHQNEYLVPRSRRKGLNAIIKNSVAY